MSINFLNVLSGGRVGLFCLIALLSGFNARLQAQDYDMLTLKRINLERNKDHDGGMYFLTQTADPVAIITPLAMLGAGIITKNKELETNGRVTALAVLGTYSVGYVLKKVVNRPRPYQTYAFIDNYKEERGSSFPSGSTAVAFSAATSLSMTFKKWYVVVPAYAWAGSVGYSRMHLGAHYPTDVLAGAVLGTASVIVSKKLNQWVNRPSAQKKPAATGL